MRLLSRSESQGSGAVTKKAKGLKKIAGVKLSKTLRKSALGTLLNSQLGREILADALMAAAGAAAAALVKNRPSARQVADAGEAVADAGAHAATATRDTVQSAAGAVAELVTEAARQILPGARSGARAKGLPEDAGERYGHLADRAANGKKDKQRGRSSKH
jgi:hypothetical protein